MDEIIELFKDIKYGLAYELSNLSNEDILLSLAWAKERIDAFAKRLEETLNVSDSTD